MPREIRIDIKSVKLIWDTVEKRKETFKLPKKSLWKIKNNDAVFLKCQQRIWKIKWRDLP